MQRLLLMTAFLALITACSSSRPNGAEEEVNFYNGKGGAPVAAAPSASPQAPRKEFCNTQCGNMGMRANPDPAGGGCRCGSTSR